MQKEHSVAVEELLEELKEQQEAPLDENAQKNSRWRRPIVGYLLSIPCVALGLLLLLVEYQVLHRSFFPSAPLILSIVCVGLLWGVGPAFLATFLSGVTLYSCYVLPFGHLNLAPLNAFVEVLPFFLVACIVAYITGQREALRRKLLLSRTESRKRAAQFEAIFESIADPVVVYSTTGSILNMNAVGKDFLQSTLPYPSLSLPLQNRLALLNLRDEHGHVLDTDNGPQMRIIKGEVFPSFRPMDVIINDVNGNERYLSISGAPICDQDGTITAAVCIYREMTEQRHLVQQYHETAQKAEERASELEAIFDAMTDAVFIYNTDGGIRHMNLAGRNMVDSCRRPDYSSTYLHERMALLDIRDEHGMPLATEQWPLVKILQGEVIAGEKAVDVLMHTLDGRDIHCSITGAPVRDSSGQIMGAVGVVRDVTERRQLEHAIRQSERDAATWAGQLEATFEAMTDSIYICDVAGHFLYTNGALRKLFALPPDFNPDYASLSLADMVAKFRPRDIHGALLPVDLQPMQRILRGEVLNDATSQDVLVRMKDGRDALLNICGAPVRNREGEIIGAVIIYRDVTRQRQLEQRTRDAFQALLDMAEALVHVPETVDETFVDEPSFASLAVAKQVIRRLLLLTSHALGCSRIGVTAIMPETGRLQPVVAIGQTPEQERFWYEQISTRYIHEYVPEDVRERLCSGEIFIRDSSYPPLQETVEVYNVRTMLTAPMSMNDQLVGFLNLDYGEDVHEFTAHEMAFAGATAKLAALVIERERLLTERAEARASEITLREINRRMDEFLSVASHELRTPLTSLKANIQLAERQVTKVSTSQPASSDKIARDLGFVASLLGRADRQTELLNRLVGDLLDVSRIQANKLELHKESCDLLSIVGDAVNEQRQVVSPREIYLELPSFTTLNVMADRDRIGQVITNYLTNALKYSDAQVPVSVAVTCDPQMQEVRVAVKDQGPGLTMEEQKYIWERFYQVERVEVLSGSSVGLGLGLHICRTIIERHDGEVGVESMPGEGSTFWFTLPVLVEEKEDGVKKER